ncbi:MAG: ribonucleotide-diphosphate reductase subunit beta [Pseudomonas sp.]
MPQIITDLSPADRLRFISLDERRVIEGPMDKLMQISPAKYREPLDIMEKAMRDDWKHWHVTLVDDLAHFRSLDAKTRRVIQKDLGFLSNLDGIQLNTLANSIGTHITAPEYRMAIVRQTYEEEVHVLTYDRMITSLEMDPVETYNLFMTDEILRAKNEHIIRMAEILGTDFSGENFVRGLAANQALEGIYFQFGFKVFYVIHKRGLMGGCAQNIRYIQRDEASHLRLFNSMWRQIKIERPELYTAEVLRDCKQVLKEAAEMEVVWAKHMIEGGILGLTNDIAEGSIKFGANQVANAVGLGDIWPEVTKDPLAWCDAYLKEHGIETNFFEQKVLEYKDEALVW